jgi:hypothetical protein
MHNKKALKAAINDKTTPAAIRNLRFTMNIVIVMLIALSTIETTINNA